MLANVWRELKSAASEIFGAPIVDSSFTLAGMSFNLFQGHFDPEVFLEHPDKEDYFNIRNALCGGRCVSENGIYQVPMLNHYIQLLCHSIINHMVILSELNLEIKIYLLGIYYVKIHPNVDPPYNFFPLRKSANTGRKKKESK